MAAAGADIIDVGGESTRPALAADAARRGAGAHPAGDTRPRRGGAARLRGHPPRRHDGGGARCRCGHRQRRLCACASTRMRRRWSPPRLPRRADAHARQRRPICMPRRDYDDVVGDVSRELGQRIAAALSAGIAPDRIAIDPGIGFAKTAGQSIEVLRRLPELGLARLPDPGGGIPQVVHGRGHRRSGSTAAPARLACRRPVRTVARARQSCACMT